MLIVRQELCTVSRLGVGDHARQSVCHVVVIESIFRIYQIVNEVQLAVGGLSESPTKRALLFESVKLKSACAVNWGNLQFFITQSLGNYSIRFKLPLF